MVVGIPKELKNNENRVAVTPSGVLELTRQNHQVYVQKDAGTGSGFRDSEYEKAGATLLPDIKRVYDVSEMIVKVKEPVAEEYELIRPEQLLFTYFHFASSEPLTQAMIERRAVCLAYETVENADRSLPLLIPMSEVAGRMSIQEGAKYLERPSGGKGILLGGVAGVKPANVLVLGGGVVGTQAAKMAAGLGANVTIMDISLPRLRYLEDIMPANVDTVMSSEYNIRQLIPNIDLIIGGVLIPGGKAPFLITADMLKLMKPGTVLVDVAIDQGGCFETSRPTTHQDPIYSIDEVVHYCVTNMPGAVPFTSTLALTNATLPFVLQLANHGWKEACLRNESLAKGLNIISGDVVHKHVASDWGLPLTSLSKYLP
jgi:alanine dehydrogenase